MFRAAVSPILIALSKCSTRIGPNTGWSWQGDVAGGEHAGHRRLQRRPHGDAAALVEPVPAISSTLGSVPTPTIATSASMPSAAVTTASRRPSPSQTRDRLVEEHPDPVVAVQRLQRPPDLGAEHPVQGGLEDLDHRHVVAEHAHRRRDLGPYEPHADADDARAVDGRILDALGVGRPQVEDARAARRPARRACGCGCRSRRAERRTRRSPPAITTRDRARRAAPHGPRGASTSWSAYHPRAARTAPRAAARFAGTPWRARAARTGSGSAPISHDPARRTLVSERGGRGGAGQRAADDANDWSCATRCLRPRSSGRRPRPTRVGRDRLGRRPSTTSPVTMSKTLP